MGFLKGKKGQSGWMAISLTSEGLCVAHSIPGPQGKPVVTICGMTQANPANPADFAKAAREMQFSRYHCTTLLGPNDYQMVVVEAPNVPPDELKTAVRWRVKDLLDYHIDDATIDVLDIPVDKSGPSRSHSMYAVAARNDVIHKRVALFDDARVPLEVIDVPEMAQRNIASLLEQPGRGVALLSFDEADGLLTISFNGELYLARHIDISWRDIAEASPDQQHGYFDRITLELQRSLDHLERQFQFVGIHQLWLAPMPAGEALRQYLSANLYMPVVLVDLNDIFDFAPVPALESTQNQVRFFLTLGATLRQEARAL
jgi:MSHA biogenesis protein MshI